MKQNIIIALAMLSLIVGSVAFYRSFTMPAPAEEEYELAEAMGYLQRFMDKLYFAGQAGNWELADFYLHELDEFGGEIIQANKVEDGVAITPLMNAMYVPSLEVMEAAVKARDVAAFNTHYRNTVMSCNACHAAASHAFINIKIPDEPTYRNQEFAPAKALEIP